MPSRDCPSHSSLLSPHFSCRLCGVHVRRILKRLVQWAHRGQEISIRVKLMAIVVGMALLMGWAVIVEVSATFSDTLQSTWDDHARAVAREVASRSTDLILNDDRGALGQLLTGWRDDEQDVSYLFVVGPDGTVLAHTFPSAVPASLLGANSPSSGDPGVTLLSYGGSPIRDTAYPILGGRAGVVRLGMSETRLRESVRSLVWRLLLIVLVASAVGVGLVLILTNRIIRPLAELVDAARSIAKGNSGRRASITTGDEVGRLGAAFNVMAESLGCSADENSRLLEEVRTRDALRLRLLDQVIGAQEEERRRIARELHDETGQSLTSILISLRILEESVQQCGPCARSDGVRTQAEGARTVAVQTLDEVRRLSRDLRPSALDDLGLSAALERCAKEFARRCSIPIDYQVVGMEDVRLPPRTETALYRIAQEALTNVARYSGAQNVSLVLERQGAGVHVIIEDDGCGFDVAAALRAHGGTMGLLSMQERAHLVGGKLTVESLPGQGTTVFAEAPLVENVRTGEHEISEHQISIGPVAGGPGD